MCKVYNTVGSLTTIKNHLQKHAIDEFNSIKQLIDFQKNYPALQQQIIADHIKIIQTETDDLNNEIRHLKSSSIQRDLTLNDYCQLHKNKSKLKLTA